MHRTKTAKRTCSQMLQALEKWMEKADPGGELSGALEKSLAPDMYPFASQICFACFLVQEAICRLSGKAVPDEILEIRQRGWEIAERPLDASGLRSMISETCARLAALPEGELDKASQEPIIFSLPDGMTFEMSPDEFLQDWTIPQFYFHLCMAYAILRNNLVPLGKVDYVRHMLGYVRDGNT